MSREQAYARVGDTFVYEPVVYPREAGAAVLDQAQIDALPEYSSSLPSGVFEHKVWKARRYFHARRDFPGGIERPGDYFVLCEYKSKLLADGSVDPDRMAIVRVPIISSAELTALAAALLWWLP